MDTFTDMFDTMNTVIAVGWTVIFAAIFIVMMAFLLAFSRSKAKYRPRKK